MTLIVPIHFGQDDEARLLVDILTNTEGVLVRGITDKSVNLVVEALRDLDYGDWPGAVEELPELNHGEQRVTWGGYILTYHTGLGYLSFDREVTHE